MADLTPMLKRGLTLEGDARVTRRDELCLSHLVLTLPGEAEGDGLTLKLRGKLKIPGARAAFGEMMDKLPKEGENGDVKETSDGREGRSNRRR